MINKSVGFTLIELIITITIAGILLAIAAPNFSSLISNSKLTTSNNDLLTALLLGKSEALKTGSPVTLCKRNTAGTSCDSAVSWHNGWLLFSDQNKDGVINAGDSIIRVYPSLTTGITLSYGLNQVTFNSLGFSEGYIGTFELCDGRGASFAHGLLIANTGQLSQAVDSNADGIKEESNGTNFTCS